jgi:antitoxin MazE
MMTTITQIGNSQGIRIPQQLLRLLRITTNQQVELKVENNALVVSPIKTHRQKWLQQFLQNKQQISQQISAKSTVININDHSWDDQEWQW